MIFGQTLTRLANGINAVYLMINLVINQVTGGGFFIRRDSQQNKFAKISIGNFSIVNRLIDLIHWLGINALTRFGIIFNFNGKITADGFDKDCIQNINMWKAPLN